MDESPIEELVKQAEWLPNIKIARSPHIGQLVKAMATAVVEFGEIRKDKVNPFFKASGGQYTSLEEIIGATALALAKQGVIVLQCPMTKFQTKEAGVTTLIAHTSDEWIAGELLMPVAQWTAHGVKSGVTYSRRTAEESMLNVAGKEDDDDANAAVGKAAAPMPRPPQAPRPPEAKPEAKPVGRPRKQPIEPSEAQPPQEANPEPQPQAEPQKPKSWGLPWPQAFYAVAQKNGHSETEAREFLGSIGYEHARDVPPHKVKECMQWAANRE